MWPSNSEIDVDSGSVLVLRWLIILQFTLSSSTWYQYWRVMLEESNRNTVSACSMVTELWHRRWPTSSLDVISTDKLLIDNLHYRDDGTGRDTTSCRHYIQTSHDVITVSCSNLAAPPDRAYSLYKRLVGCVWGGEVVETWNDGVTRQIHAGDATSLRTDWRWCHVVV